MPRNRVGQTLLFNLEIEKSARRNNSRSMKQKQVEKLQQQQQ